MTPIFKFSLLGLGAASVGGGSYVCWSNRDSIKEFFWGSSGRGNGGIQQPVAPASPSGTGSESSSTGGSVAVEGPAASVTSSSSSSGTGSGASGASGTPGSTTSPHVPAGPRVPGNGGGETANSPQPQTQNVDGGAGTENTPTGEIGQGGIDQGNGTSGALPTSSRGTGSGASEHRGNGASGSSEISPTPQVPAGPRVPPQQQPQDAAVGAGSESASEDRGTSEEPRVDGTGTPGASRRSESLPTLPTPAGQQVASQSDTVRTVDSSPSGQPQAPQQTRQEDTAEGAGGHGQADGLANGGLPQQQQNQEHSVSNVQGPREGSSGTIQSPQVPSGQGASGIGAGRSADTSPSGQPQPQQQDQVQDTQRTLESPAGTTESSQLRSDNQSGESQRSGNGTDQVATNTPREDQVSDSVTGSVGGGTPSSTPTAIPTVVEGSQTTDPNATSGGGAPAPGLTPEGSSSLPGVGGSVTGEGGTTDSGTSGSGRVALPGAEVNGPQGLAGGSGEGQGGSGPENSSVGENRAGTQRPTVPGVGNPDTPRPAGEGGSSQPAPGGQPSTTDGGVTQTGQSGQQPSTDGNGRGSGVGTPTSERSPSIPEIGVPGAQGAAGETVETPSVLSGSGDSRPQEPSGVVNGSNQSGLGGGGASVTEGTSSLPANDSSDGTTLPRSGATGTPGAAEGTGGTPTVVPNTDESSQTVDPNASSNERTPVLAPAAEGSLGSSSGASIPAPETPAIEGLDAQNASRRTGEVQGGSESQNASEAGNVANSPSSGSSDEASLPLPGVGENGSDGQGSTGGEGASNPTGSDGRSSIPVRDNSRTGPENVARSRGAAGTPGPDGAGNRANSPASGVGETGTGTQSPTVPGNEPSQPVPPGQPSATDVVQTVQTIDNPGLVSGARSGQADNGGSRREDQGATNNTGQQPVVTAPGSTTELPTGGELPASPGADSGISNGAGTTTIDYLCLFGGYETTNKKAIKDFLASTNMGGSQGIQILDESYDKGFKCAKDMDDSLLGGLKDYMDTVKNSFSIQNNRPGNNPMVWAFKKKDDNSGWTMYESDNSDDPGGILTAITAPSNTPSES